MADRRVAIFPWRAPLGTRAYIVSDQPAHAIDNEMTRLPQGTTIGPRISRAALSSSASTAPSSMFGAYPTLQRVPDNEDVRRPDPQAPGFGAFSQGLKRFLYRGG